MTADPPACVSKKWAPRKRSKSSMIWAADSGGRASTVMAETTSIIQT